MLKRFWTWLFGAKDAGVVYPFRYINEAMKAKDPELYEIVGSMTLYQGAMKWRKRYPQDFPELADEAQ